MFKKLLMLLVLVLFAVGCSSVNKKELNQKVVDAYSILTNRSVPHDITHWREMVPQKTKQTYDRKTGVHSVEQSDFKEVEGMIMVSEIVSGLPIGGNMIMFSPKERDYLIAHRIDYIHDFVATALIKTNKNEKQGCSNAPDIKMKVGYQY